MKIRPLEDRVLVRKEEGEDRTASGIILTGNGVEKPYWATVISVGPGSDMVKMEVAPGDKVLCAKYGGTDVKIDDEDYVLYQHKDILAIVEEE